MSKMTYEQHVRQQLGEHLEAEHGAWLDARIARQLPIALGQSVALFSAPDPAGQWVTLNGACTPTSDHTDTWVRVIGEQGQAGWVERFDLLMAIGEMAEVVAGAERAAGWSTQP